MSNGTVGREGWVATDNGTISREVKENGTFARKVTNNGQDWMVWVDNGTVGRDVTENRTVEWGTKRMER